VRGARRSRTPSGPVSRMWREGRFGRLRLSAECGECSGLAPRIKWSPSQNGGPTGAVQPWMPGAARERRRPSRPSSIAGGDPAPRMHGIRAWRRSETGSMQASAGRSPASCRRASRSIPVPPGVKPAAGRSSLTEAHLSCRPCRGAGPDSSQGRAETPFAKSDKCPFLGPLILTGPGARLPLPGDGQEVLTAVPCLSEGELTQPTPESRSVRPNRLLG
jgi:hypothetical protein